jgi:hypothetical protein
MSVVNITEPSAMFFVMRPDDFNPRIAGARARGSRVWPVTWSRRELSTGSPREAH